MIGVTSAHRPPWGAPVPANRWDLAPEPVPGLRVSVVVCHYEQPVQLARTLCALRQQTRPPYEVVVADDGSRDVPVVPDGVRLVRQEDRGFRAAAARNLGVAATSGDLLVLLDADTAPEPGYLAAITDLPSRLPECLVVGRRRHATYDDEVRLELPEPAWLADAYASTRDLLDADHTSHRFVVGAVMACTRWWWEEIGGSDPTFSAYGGEDWDLAHRSWLNGGLVAHRRDAVAWHDGPDAGGRPRDRSRETAETVATADRVAAPGTGWRGLTRGPADVVVTVPAHVRGAELLVTLDSLWSAVPTARALLTPPQRDEVGADPRVVDTVPPARLLLDLARGCFGDWAAALGALDGYGRRDLGVGMLTDLRLVRRSRLWQDRDLAPDHLERDRHLTAWEPRHSLESWLGGWAR